MNAGTWFTLGALSVVVAEVMGALWECYIINKEIKRMIAQEEMKERES